MPVSLCPLREHNGIVMAAQVFDSDILTDRNIAPKIAGAVRRDALKHLADGLNLLMIRRDARAHETIRSRQLLENIDVYGRAGLEQGLGREESAGAAADNRNAQGTLFRAEGGAGGVGRFASLLARLAHTAPTIAVAEPAARTTGNRAPPSKIPLEAETKRAPFDLPEGESEITGGFMVEYSAMTYALFFLGEYANMILMSAMTVVLFLGGWLPPFGIEALSIIPGFIWFALKTLLIMFFFIWTRATFPRYRYDQLMRLGWKVFLPFTLLWVVVVSGTLLYFDALP